MTATKPYQEALRRISEAGDALQLDLSDLPSLRALPPQIDRLKSLKSLDLRYTQIRTLPPAIGRLQNLQDLDLSHSTIEDLPPEIGQLRNLKLLDLTATKLTDLPLEFGAPSAMICYCS